MSKAREDDRRAVQLNAMTRTFTLSDQH